MISSTIWAIEYRYAEDSGRMTNWRNLGLFFEDKERALDRVAELAKIHSEDGWEFRSKRLVRG